MNSFDLLDENGCFTNLTYEEGLTLADAFYPDTPVETTEPAQQKPVPVPEQETQQELKPQTGLPLDDEVGPLTADTEQLPDATPTEEDSAQKSGDIIANNLPSSFNTPSTSVAQNQPLSWGFENMPSENALNNTADEDLPESIAKKPEATPIPPSSGNKSELKSEMQLEDEDEEMEDSPPRPFPLFESGQGDGGRRNSNPEVDTEDMDLGAGDKQDDLAARNSAGAGEGPPDVPEYGEEGAHVGDDMAVEEKDSESRISGTEMDVDNPEPVAECEDVQASPPNDTAAAEKEDNDRTADDLPLEDVPEQPAESTAGNGASVRAGMKHARDSLSPGPSPSRRPQTKKQKTFVPGEMEIPQDVPGEVEAADDGEERKQQAPAESAKKEKSFLDLDASDSTLTDLSSTQLSTPEANETSVKAATQQPNGDDRAMVGVEDDIPQRMNISSRLRQRGAKKAEELLSQPNKAETQRQEEEEDESAMADVEDDIPKQTNISTRLRQRGTKKPDETAKESNETEAQQQDEDESPMADVEDDLSQQTNNISTRLRERSAKQLDRPEPTAKPNKHDSSTQASKPKSKAKPKPKGASTSTKPTQPTNESSEPESSSQVSRPRPKPKPKAKSSKPPSAKPKTAMTAPTPAPDPDEAIGGQYKVPTTRGKAEAEKKENAKPAMAAKNRHTKKK